jgi:predicted metal-dependent hydrolase
VVLPLRAPLSLAATLVEQHGTWLRRQIARVDERDAQLAARPALGAGRILSLHGVPHDVVVDEAAAAARGRVVRRSGQGMPAGAPARDVLDVQPGADGQSPAALLEAWLRREAREVLVRRVGELGLNVGAAPVAVTIRGQRGRWGSASRNGRISLNWRLILAPPDVRDYVIVHELAHLLVAGHSAAFWAVVRRHVADPSAARGWLRGHHGELLAALD